MYIINNLHKYIIQSKVTVKSVQATMKRFRLADEIKSTALITGLRNINIMLLTAVEG